MSVSHYERNTNLFEIHTNPSNYIVFLYFTFMLTHCSKLGPRGPSLAYLFEFQIVQNNSIESRQLGSCIVTDITCANPLGNPTFILLLFRICMFLWKRTFYRYFRFDCLGIRAFERYWKTIWICINFSFKNFSQRHLNSFHLPLRVY